MKRTIFFKTLTIGLLFIFTIGCSKHQENSTTSSSPEEQLTIASWGGSFQEAQRKAFFKPFEDQYHVKIVEASHTGDLAQVKAMVESGNVQWDIIDVDSYMLHLGKKQNLYEKLDYSGIIREDFIPQALDDYGIGSDTVGTILAYSTKQYPAEKPHPENWADFWNIQKFPGPRSLRNFPMETLEFALLADGANPKKLYPLDVDRAFKSLDKIKKNVSVWWEAGEQPPQLLSSGDVVMTSSWNGRIYNAEKADKPVQLVWNQGILGLDYWVVLRGSKHKDLAMKFIAFALGVDPEASLPSYIPYGPTNKKAMAKVPKSLINDLPTSPQNLPKLIPINGEWWADHFGEVEERWRKWMSQ